MNVEELESIIRDELRRDAANAPAGRQLRAAVLDAVTDLPMAERPVRRWAVPLLVAAAVVALAIAATLLPRAFGKHSQPAHPTPTPAPSLPAAPSPVGVTCASGQQLVSGLGTRFTDSAGQVRYAYEYYCAGSNGNRTASQIEQFQLVDGRLTHQPGSLIQAGANLYLMSLTGTGGGVVVRAYDTTPGINGHPGGVVEDWNIQVDADAEASSSEPIAQPCLATDLTVQWTQANEPTPHTVLKLTNHSGKSCAVWGNPHYTQVAGQQRVTFSSVLRGPAGGLAADEPSAPPLLLQPGQSAYSALGSEPVNNACFVPTVSVALANGVQLGSHSSDCSVVSYPLVRAENGSESHPESEAPASATGSCIGDSNVGIEFGSLHVTGDRGGETVVLRAVNPTTCTMTGYPNLRALDLAGNLELIASQTLHGALGGEPAGSPRQVSLEPGKPISFLAEWSRGAATGNCFADGRLSLALGGSTFTGGPRLGRFCDLQVHPFVPGDTGSD